MTYPKESLTILYTGIHSNITAKLCKEGKDVIDKGESNMLSDFTSSIINCSIKSNNNCNNNYTVDYYLLDDNVLSALNGDLDDTGDTGDNVDSIKTNDDSNSSIEEKDVEVENGIGANATKVKKVPIHEAAYQNLLSKGTEKMKIMNLPIMGYRKNCRLQREQTVISDSTYNNMMNTNENSLCNMIIDKLTYENDGNIFGTWDSAIK